MNIRMIAVIIDILIIDDSNIVYSWTYSWHYSLAIEAIGNE
jgi:hypothetical protein